MKNVLSAAQVRAAEQFAINNGVDELFLRYSAALAVADVAAKRIQSRPDSKIAVFCGVGGNGCDGIIAACRLKKLGYIVAAYVVGDKSKIDGSVAAFAANEGLCLCDAGEYKKTADVIIDAIFGIGLNRDIEGEAAKVIETLNAQRAAFKLAVDIPSGLNADSGNVMGVCFKADLTLSFSCYKTGMLFGSGRDMCGTIEVCDVGIKTESNIHVYEDEDFPKYTREKSAHKGTAGRVYIIGGCGDMVGAPIMAGAAAHAAYLNGAGTVTVCMPSVHRAAMSARATMTLMSFLPDTKEGFIRFDKSALDEIIDKASAICIGVGMGSNPELKQIVRYICDNFDKSVVIDADAINAIKLDYEFIKTAKAKVILTPHVGEFKRLTGKAATIENAVALAAEIGAVVVLKSATTIITDGAEVRINVKGTPAMAKGGTGDVLGGCITALTCAFSPIDAATVACYRNGVGAERAVSSYSEMMLTAGGILNFADYDE